MHSNGRVREDQLPLLMGAGNKEVLPIYTGYNVKEERGTPKCNSGIRTYFQMGCNWTKIWKWVGELWTKGTTCTKEWI